MSARTIFMERLPLHPLLGRHVYFDSLSKAYAVQPTRAPVTSIRHSQNIGILDQGQVGSCTGNAACSCAYHEPVMGDWAHEWSYTPDESGALAWYEANTANDSYPGTYTPDDTGSDGLTASKVAIEAGIITGYQAALDLDSSLQALMKGPGITGIPWYPSMFDAPASGLLTVDMSQPVSGGHELCVDEVVAANALGNGVDEILVGGPNSWGTGWGDGGRWYLKASDWWKLRQNNGDVYFWVPNAQPAPAPTPDPSGPVPSMADREMWADTAPFRADHHVVPHIVAAAKALNAWGAEMGLA